MTFVWHSLIAALVPIALRDIPLALERFLHHLARSGRKARERSVDRFRRQLMCAGENDA
jgi:hypothetical protein